MLEKYVSRRLVPVNDIFLSDLKTENILSSQCRRIIVTTTFHKSRKSRATQNLMVNHSLLAELNKQDRVQQKVLSQTRSVSVRGDHFSFSPPGAQCFTRRLVKEKEKKGEDVTERIRRFGGKGGGGREGPKAEGTKKEA